MEHRNPAWRVGLAAAVLGTAVQLCHYGVPKRVVSFLTQPETAAFLIYLGTGRDVRFSSASEVFSPDFMESPPPSLPRPKAQPLPDFSEAPVPEVYYAVSKSPDLEALLAQPLAWDLTGEAPSVLILHTHSTESYTKKGEDYVESVRWRTLDEGYNMLSIGSHLAQCLEDLGIGVIQDRQVYDHPSYNGSYTRAREAIGAYLEKYPTIQLVLDLHRDAADDGFGGQMDTSATVDGKESARIMMVVGTNAGGMNHPDWEENLALALKLHVVLEKSHPGLCRTISFRKQRFNQDLSPGAMLIEVGAAGNTHSEALIAAEALAEGIIELARGSATSDSVS